MEDTTEYKIKLGEPIISNLGGLGFRFKFQIASASRLDSKAAEGVDLTTQSRISSQWDFDQDRTIDCKKVKMESKSKSWKQHYATLTTDKAGKRNMEAFSIALQSGKTTDAKIAAIAGDQNIFILGSDGEKGVRIVHSPKNLGGNLNRPSNKVACLIGLGPRATPVTLSLETALADCKIVTPSFEILSNCNTVK